MKTYRTSITSITTLIHIPTFSIDVNILSLITTLEHVLLAIFLGVALIGLTTD